MNIKKIHITENQKERLFEASFRLSELDKYDNVNDMVKYCHKTLGDELGHGSTRIVFPIGDDTVIKLALDDSCAAGFEQNRQEYLNNQINNDIKELFPQVYQHAHNFAWIELERVLPIEEEDFVTLLGIKWNWMNLELTDEYSKYRVEQENPKFYCLNPYTNEYEEYECTVQGFIEWAECIARGADDSNEESQTYIALMEKNRWFSLLFKYVQAEGNGFTDLIIDNFGIAMRNGEPTIVILDNGYDVLT